MPSIEELEAALAEARAAEQRLTVGNSVPTGPNFTPQWEQPQKAPSEPRSDPYAPTAWGSDEYDFVTPLGQRCRLRTMPIEELATAGILDKITRLPGLTAELVKQAEGQPPSIEQMPDRETIETLVEVVNALVPLVVVQPKIWPLPDPEGDEQKQAGRIYVDSIDLRDRIAIMHRAIGPLTKLDSFRN